MPSDHTLYMQLAARFAEVFFFNSRNTTKTGSQSSENPKSSRTRTPTHTHTYTTRTYTHAHARCIFFCSPLL